MKPVNRRSFMKITGSTLGIGVLYSALPTVATGEAGEMIRWLMPHFAQDDRARGSGRCFGSQVRASCIGPSLRSAVASLRSG